MSPLQDELKKKKPFDSLSQEVVLNLMRTTDQIQIHFTRLFQEFDLTHSQYNILRILRGEGAPMKSLEIASRTITVVPGITGLIDRLEKKELVQRERSTEDRRTIFVSITEQGMDLLRRIDAPLNELHEKVVGHMTRDDLQQLNQLLEKAREFCPKGQKDLACPGD